MENSSMSGDAAAESGDWRTQLRADSRQRIVNKIWDTLKIQIPMSGHEGLEEVRKLAVRFEEKIYKVATSQSDYLRKISLKMAIIESKSQNPMANAASNGTNSPDQETELWLEPEVSEDDEDGSVYDPIGIDVSNAGVP